MARQIVYLQGGKTARDLESSKAGGSVFVCVCLKNGTALPTTRTLKALRFKNRLGSASSHRVAIGSARSVSGRYSHTVPG
jgi:hypothetical protein